MAPDSFKDTARASTPCPKKGARGISFLLSILHFHCQQEMTKQDEGKPLRIRNDFDTRVHEHKQTSRSFKALQSLPLHPPEIMLPQRAVTGLSRHVEDGEVQVVLSKLFDLESDRRCCLKRSRLPGTSRTRQRAHHGAFAYCGGDGSLVLSIKYISKQRLWLVLVQSAIEGLSICVCSAAEIVRPPSGSRFVPSCAMMPMPVSTRHHTASIPCSA